MLVFMDDCFKLFIYLNAYTGGNFIRGNQILLGPFWKVHKSPCLSKSNSIEFEYINVTIFFKNILNRWEIEITYFLLQNRILNLKALLLKCYKLPEVTNRV